MDGYILRRYNYNLETGTVGTDNDDLANILYNINRMEMKAGYTPADTEDMRKNFGDAFFMSADSCLHFENFTQTFKEKLNATDVETAQKALDEALSLLRAIEPPQTDTALMHNAIQNAYQTSLAVVPTLLQLEEQSV